MRVAIIIPDRGDRPEFMSNCLRMIERQTISQNKENTVLTFVAGGDPVSDKCDITFRYRRTYEIITASANQNIFCPDVIACMENDDAYCADYLQVMIDAWEQHERPELFGTNYTIYYHLKIKRYFTFRHSQRSSMMSTLIKPGLEFTWPKDHDPYTDQWLWMNNNGIKSKVVFEPNHIICVGMKHGQGMVGGDFHTGRLDRYDPVKSKGNEDNGFLQNTLDEESYKFYSSLPFFGKNN
jgi:hypothetical protein